MTKQEMAEWLAEKVLGWERVNFVAEGYIGENWLWKVPHTFRSYPEVKRGDIQTIYEFIYSPDGLLAVIEQVRKFEPTPKSICLAWSAFLLYGDYEAFYNAVYEAMK